MAECKVFELPKCVDNVMHGRNYDVLQIRCVLDLTNELYLLCSHHFCRRVLHYVLNREMNARLGICTEGMMLCTQLYHS